MPRNYRISATPIGTLESFFNNLFYEKGEQIEIDGKLYALRESGNLPKKDPIRQGAYKGLLNIVKENPRSNSTQELEIKIR